ncbi:cache domain-containing sensor histidine kinase [Cohnella caldifontis]|uniref:cache domain-containing sensor histidine kinase n=1 Tax=Cohnella caldifontis TaxID=3027471 RepID=UPI0023ED7E3C|nr:sensor histidine kinase [Cohnella sp. YIM B05605]
MRLGKYGWNKSSYRFKLAFLAVLLSACGLSFVVLTTLFNVRDISVQMHDDSERQLYQQYGGSMTSYFKEINSLSTYLRNGEITNFSRNYWNLRDPELAASKLEEIKRLIDRLNLYDMQVDAIYMFGSNPNQTGLAKSIVSYLPALDVMPSVNDIETLGFLGILLRDNGFPVYYMPGEWSRRIAELPPGKREYAKASGVEAYLLKLEGRVSVTSYADNVLQSVVLRDEVFNRLLYDVILKRAGAMVIDREGRVVWSNPTRSSQPAFDAAKLSGVANGEGSLSLNGQDIRYQQLSPFGFTWIQYAPSPAWGDDQAPFIRQTVLVALLGMAAAIVAAWWISDRICEPISGLALLLSRKGKRLPVGPIPEQFQHRTFLRRTPLRRKLFYMFLLSSIAPVLLVGMACSSQAYNATKHKLYESVDNWTRRLSNEIRAKQASYENLIRRLAADGEMAAIVKDQQVIGEEDKKTLESMFIKQTEGIGDIAYFVLRSITGTALYASIYTNNLELFETDADLETPFAAAAGDTVWLEGRKDVFNQQNLTLVKRLEIPGRSSPADNVDVGYLEIALKLTALHAAFPHLQTEYVIVRDDRRFLAGSTNDDSYVASARRAAAYRGDDDGKSAESPYETKIDGRHYLLATQRVPGTDWTVVAYQPTLEISQTSRSLLERNIGITLLASILVFLLSIVVSGLLVRPIERLKREMERVGRGEGEISSGLRHEATDEIGELIASFNVMITQINELMHENIDRQVRERELDRLKTHAELGMLQQQINPHFLYNTLEAINMRSLQLGATEVSRMVTALARLFRYAISSATDLVDLDQELEHTRNYATIQEIRFRDRFRVDWRIEPQTRECKVLKLLLQPIVENAINHGLAEYTADGVVEIVSRLEGEHLILEVSDNGIGMEEEELGALHAKLIAPPPVDTPVFSARRTGVGLLNVYQRLKFHYGDAADLSVDSEPMSGTRVRIRIPVQQV